MVGVGIPENEEFFIMTQPGAWSVYSMITIIATLFAIWHDPDKI